MRIAFNIALIISVLYLPWWVGALILLVACFVIDRFYEVFMYGMAIDALYSTSTGVHGFVYAGSLYAVVVFIIASLLRDKLSW